MARLIHLFVLYSQKQEEERIARIHARQEAARKLAHNVEILLEQRALVTGNKTNRDQTKRMSSRDLLATARQVAQNFNSLSYRMRSDFAIDDKTKSTRTNISQKSPHFQKHCPGKTSHDQNQNISGEAKAKEEMLQAASKGGIAFTIGFEERDATGSSLCHNLQSPTKRKTKTPVTVKDIEEKQKKAEERRNVSP